MEIKLNIANKEGKTVTLPMEDGKVLYGKKLGDSFKGELIDRTGYVFRISGGSNNSGFPMRRDVEGTARRKVLISGGVGLHSRRKGLRRRRSVSGNTIGPSTTQVNIVVEKAGKQPLVEATKEEASTEKGTAAEHA